MKPAKAQEKEYRPGDFITPREMARITGYTAKEFTDARRRAEFGFDFTVVRLKPSSPKLLFLRSEFNRFLDLRVREAQNQKGR